METESGQALYPKPTGTAWGMFWIDGEHFGQKLMQFGQFFKLVLNQKLLTMF